MNRGVGPVDEAQLVEQQQARIDILEPPKLSAKEFRSAFQAFRQIAACIRSAWRRQYPTRASRPSLAAMRASRSQPAQHITAENVCTLAIERNSQSPASGWS